MAKQRQCVDCGEELTNEEIKTYGNRCDACANIEEDEEYSEQADWEKLDYSNK